MTKLDLLNGPTYRSEDSSEQIEQLIIFIHGLGADGNDLIGLAPYFSEVCPNAMFIAPNGPEKCDMMPMQAESGYQWFSLQNRGKEAMLEGARIAEPTLNSFIDQQIEKYGLQENQVALIGFSQGTMMSMFCGTRRKTEIAGIIGFSGQVVGKEVLKNEITSYPPILLINGDQDELIPIQEQEIAVKALKQENISVENHIVIGLGHSIDLEGIQLAQEFLSKIFAIK